MNKKIDVRDAKVTDCVVIAKLIKEMWDEIRPDIPLSEKSVSNMVVEMVRSVEPQTIYLKVAESEGEAIGFIHGSVHYQPRLDKISGNCYDVYVRKEFRDSSLGVRLIQDLMDWCRKQGASQGFFIVHKNDVHRWIKRKDYELFQVTFSIDLLAGDDE